MMGNSSNWMLNSKAAWSTRNGLIAADFLRGASFSCRWTRPWEWSAYTDANVLGERPTFRCADRNPAEPDS
jgi:hypothetical protein